MTVRSCWVVAGELAVYAKAGCYKWWWQTYLHHKKDFYHDFSITILLVAFQPLDHVQGDVGNRVIRYVYVKYVINTRLFRHFSRFNEHHSYLSSSTDGNTIWYAILHNFILSTHFEFETEKEIKQFHRQTLWFRCPCKYPDRARNCQSTNLYIKDIKIERNSLKGTLNSTSPYFAKRLTKIIQFLEFCKLNKKTEKHSNINQKEKISRKSPFPK